MKVKNWSYEEYPEFSYDKADGIIPSDGNEMGVQYIPDVVYAEYENISLTLQILIPYNRNTPIGSKPYPCIVYVQGSAWKKQDVYGSIPLVSKLAERGYVCAIVQYRDSSIATFPVPVIDAENAVRFLKKHASEYNLNKDEIIMAGSSSGGHTAVYTGICNTDKTKDNLYPGISSKTKGIIDYYGSVSVMAEDANPSTLDHCLPTSPEGMEMGGVNLREHEDLRRKLSCECNITEDTDMPPVLIVHGTKDRTVNPSGSKALYEQLKKTGHETYFYLIKGADHGRAEFFKKEVLDLDERFIRHCLTK